MRATNSFVPAEKKTVSQYIMQKDVGNIINKALGTPARAASFVSTIISVCDASPKLQMCTPNSILSAALRGEGMNLSLALGHYGIVPYGTKAQFQIMAKGLAQMAIRTGKYLDFDVFDVREGEYLGRAPRTRQPIINWIEDENIRDSLPLMGFYAYYELKSGFFKSMYWTWERILNHANRYSKAFSLEKYRKLLAGELPESELTKLREGSPWYDEPLSEAHQKMCKKTMLIQLLNDGKAPLSTELHEIILEDARIESGRDETIESLSDITRNAVERSSEIDTDSNDSNNDFNVISANDPIESSESNDSLNSVDNISESTPKKKTRIIKPVSTVNEDESAEIVSFFEK